MAIDIGDAILTFTGDTTQLDAAFVDVPAKAEASMGLAAATVKTLGQSLVDTGQAGTSLADAFKLVAPPIEQSDIALQNMAFALRGIPEAIQPIPPEVKKVETSVKEARGEAALLGEAFGIHLPRHVRSFLAEMPGVSTALSAAFSATAILFIIDAVVQLIEKIAEWSRSEEKIAEAMEALQQSQQKTFNSLEDNVLRAEARFDDLTGKHVEALRLKLQQIDNQTLGNLDNELKKLGDEALQVLQLLDRNWFSKAFLGLEGSEEAQQKLKELQKTVSEALSARTPEAYADALKALQSAFDESTKKLQGFDDQLKKHEQAVELVKNGIGPSGDIIPAPDSKSITAWEQLGKTIRGYISDVQEAKKSADFEKAADAKQEADKEAQIAAQLAKKQEQLYFEVAKAKAALEKQLEKGADDVSKKEDLALTTQLKNEEAAAQQELKLLDAKLKAAIAELNGEIQATEGAAQTKALAYKKQYDLGLITGQKYLADLKQLYDKELQDLIAILNRKEQLVILEAQNEAARRGQILTEAQAKELKGYVDLENQKQKYTDQFTAKFAKDEDLITKASDKVFKTKASWDTFFKDLQDKALTTGQKFQLLGQEITASIAQSVEAAVSGSDGFGQAMEKILKSALASLTGIAVVHVVKELAEAASDLATIGMEWHAGLHFKAAAEWAAVGAIAGVAGAAIPGGSGSGGGGGASSGSKSATITQNTSTQAGTQPTTTVNVPKLSGGGLVTQQTLAIVGDAPDGGNRPEAVIPLDDQRAMDAISKLFGGSGAGDTHNHFYIQGMIGASNLAQLSRMVSRATNTGRTRMTVANSARVTRRS